ncbi:cytochrome c oxidase polypeptide IV [Coprinopsis cinerea okayama7|uniref:Cytochrome c oxidase subunit 4, mitochondrial n=1 Tax=Coprinopsis cinerea (strain Okayama-7 / 130 / ATCC MYA-4618 / FGSC 9003) TaxID=240176 RepID=A8NU49_COPC7|nr:cytochrome c oxidase polypeptide IV [Coprinopsis cinerea okayama7\|eukprot:XP_001836377.1 cytochrome c oxidase polypeptide IV [Coprinopsis cinerea okayama7\
MFKTALQAATRPALNAVRSSARPAVALRAFSTTQRANSGPPPPQLYGSGGKPGQVPTDIEQATGIERLQLLGELEGVNVFDDSPLDSSRIGTKADPIKVLSYDVERMIGCTGSPADSHDVTWFMVNKDKISRCVECGSVYALDFRGEEHAEHHH